MNAPECTLHGRLVLDFARGRLDDAAADRADAALLSCAACRSWWHENLEDAGVATVDAAVRDAVATFHAPRDRRRAPWLAVAAAAAIVLSAAVLWQSREQPAAPSGPRTPADVVEHVFAGKGPGPAADLNDDGLVDASDLALALQTRAEKPTPQA